MKILLLGANGQLGHELHRSLLPLGEVRAAARAGHPIKLDLADLDGLARLLDREHADVIVNAAAYTAVDRAEEETALAHRINAEAVAVMARAAAAQGTALVHYSTDYVFAGDADRPYREDDPVAPINCYGASKLAGEEAIRESACAHLILRTAWVYGNRGKNFLRAILRLAGERDQLRIVADQHGAPAWSRMLAEMSAAAIHRVMLADDWRAISGTYHMSAAGQTTWHAFAQRFVTIAAERGLIDRAPLIEAITTAEFPTPARRPAWSVLDNRRFEQTFGLRVASWERQLELCMEEFT